MMGSKSKARHFAPLIHISLEELVPPEHFYRHLERSLDLSFVREFVQKTYANGGRPSIDPIVFFKLQLVMFFEGIRSERLLMRHAADRLSVLWYLGYDLGEPLPDHSSLTRIRERYGVEVFRRFFEAIVDRCQQAGLVWGKELYVDATKVNANAAMESVKPRFGVEKHLRELFATEEKEEPEPAVDGEPPLPTSEAEISPPGVIYEETMPPSQVPVPPTSVCESTVAAPVPLPVLIEAALREDLTRANEERHDWIKQGGKPDREVIRGTYRRMADFVVSTTDPDATVMPGLWGGTPCRLPYALRGGWGQGEDHSERAVHSFGSHGKPTDARSPLPHALPLETVATPGHRRHDLWNRGQHRGAGTRAHSCLCALTRF